MGVFLHQLLYGIRITTRSKFPSSSLYYHSIFPSSYHSISKTQETSQNLEPNSEIPRTHLLSRTQESSQNLEPNYEISRTHLLSRTQESSQNHTTISEIPRTHPLSKTHESSQNHIPISEIPRNHLLSKIQESSQNHTPNSEIPRTHLLSRTQESSQNHTPNSEIPRAHLLSRTQESSQNHTPSSEIPRTHLLNPNPRSKTPLEKQFETWVLKLKPGFEPEDVNEVLRSQSDPDLAFDIFRWTAQQRNYRHTHLTYLTMFRISTSCRRFGQIEAIMDEVMAGACSGSLPLYNTIINYCCKRNKLSRAIDVFRRMRKFPDCKPTLETYRMLLNAVLRKFDRLNICYAYMHTVRSLLKQMNASGVVPDIFTLNLIIKAYSKCPEIDEALRIFREMGLYKCEPDAYTYSYMIKGLCEKGRTKQAMGFYKETREKGFVPTSSTYMVLICSLALERWFDEAIEIVFHMLGNSMFPDLLTYKTVLEGLCREGREKEAFGLLEQLRDKEGVMDEKTHYSLINDLHLLSRQ